MADDVLVDNGDETDYTVSTDEGAGGHVQRVKLAYSADGSETHVGADADGLLVNLGANNDVTVTGTVTASDGGGSLTVDDGSGSLTVDDGGLSLTVDGSVTATLGSGDNTAGRVKITDGTDVADVLDLTNSNPLTVAVVDGSGNQVTSFGGSGGTSASDDAAFTAGSGSGTPMMGFVTADSVDSGDVGVVGMLANRQLKMTLYDSSGNELSVGGGTQYTEADTDASITGTAILWEDTSDTLRAVSASKPLPVGDGGGTITVDDGGTSLTVDGTVGVSGTVTVDSELTTADLDTGAGTDTRAVVGLVGSKSGGGVLIPGDATAGLKVDLGADNDVTVTGTVAVTQSGTWDEVGINDSGNSITVDDGAGSLTVDNAGTFAVQVDGSSLTALQKIDDPVLVDDAAFTPASSSVSMAGYQADETSTDSVDEGDAGAARMTLDRRQIVVNQPHAAGGCDIFRSLDLDETEEDVKTSAGTVYGWAITNTATSTRFVKFYNATAANVTVGSTTPVITFGIPGNSSDDVGANMMGGLGIKFDTAICVAATTGVADADTGAPGANDVIINVFYK